MKRRWRAGGFQIADLSGVSGMNEWREWGGLQWRRRKRQLEWGESKRGWSKWSDPNLSLLFGTSPCLWELWGITSNRRSSWRIQWWWNERGWTQIRKWAWIYRDLGCGVGPVASEFANELGIYRDLVGEFPTKKSDESWGCWDLIRKLTHNNPDHWIQTHLW